MLTLGLQGVQPAGAQARRSSSARRRRAAPRTCADHAGYLGVIAAEAAFRDGDEWLDETIATIARQPRGCCRTRCRTGVRSPRRRPATWRGSTAARPGSATIPRPCSSSAGAWRCSPGCEFGAPGAGLRAAERRDAARAGEEAVRRMASALRLELDHEHDVPARERQVLVALGLARAVEVGHLGVGQRQEVVALGVEEVGQARAEALLRQLQRALDLVPRRLDADALVAELHAAQYGRPSRSVCRVAHPCWTSTRSCAPGGTASRPPTGRWSSTTRTPTSAPTTLTASSRRRRSSIGVMARADARAVVFPMHEPDGYPAPNDVAIAAAAASDRLVAFCRLDPRVSPGGRGAPLPRRGRRRASSCTRAPSSSGWTSRACARSSRSRTSAGCPC